MNAYQCTVCGQDSSFWWSAHFMFQRSVGYCSFRCKTISNRLWIYLGGIGATIAGLLLTNIVFIIGGIFGLFLGFWATSMNRQFQFPLLNAASILDDF